MPYHVNQERFGELVEQALAELPDEFARFLQEVPVEVRDRPTAGQLRRLGMGSADLLLGLYQGRPRTRRSVEDSGQLPDVIYLYQKHIELVSRTEPELVEQIRTTVLHEIGHHFGMDEDDLDKLGYG